MKPKVVIIGHSFSSRLSIIRSVAKMGCEVTVIAMMGFKRDGKTLNTQKPIDCYSKYVSHIYYCHRRDKDGLIRILEEKCIDYNQKVILFPDSDDTVVTIDNYGEQLAKHFFFPHICNKSGSIEYWMDKIHQKEAARSVGLNVAEGVVVDIQNGKYAIPDNIQYPCYTKPLVTMNGGKGGMHCCENKKELTEALNEYISTRTRTGKVLAEQYKDIDAEYALLGFSNGKEVIIPGIMRLLVISRKNKGIALQGQVMPTDGFEETIERFKHLVLNIGFVGIFDIDFYESCGTLYFCEVNFRFGGSGYAVTKMGANLPAMYVKYCRGEEWRDFNMLINSSAIYVNERMLMDDWNNSFISNKEFDHFLYSANIRFIPDEDDPKPEHIFINHVRRRKIINYFKKALRNVK